jgi:hypothetical protein
VIQDECCDGEKGNDGLPGKPSRNGRKSPSFHAHLQQWYHTGGVFRGSAEKPVIAATEGAPPARVVLEAPPASGSVLAASPNRSLGASSVKTAVELVNSRLRGAFPKCDFDNVETEWDFCDALGEGQAA